MNTGHHRSKGFEWSYRDLLLSLMIVYMGMAALALISAEKVTKAGVNQGDIMFELTWPRDDLADVDLWVRAPGDRAVGYSHPYDVHCDLLRDDLGRPVDSESREMELTVCRGLPDGEWVADAALYTYRSGPIPVDATVEAVLTSSNQVSMVVKRVVHLTNADYDITAFRFIVKDHHVVYSSIDQIPAHLWRNDQ